MNPRYFVTGVVFGVMSLLAFFSVTYLLGWLCVLVGLSERNESKVFSGVVLVLMVAYFLFLVACAAFAIYLIGWAVSTW